MKLLVVEDDADIARGVERALRAEGFAVDVSADLPDAELKLAVNDYGVVVADRMLPSGDAVDLVARLRSGGVTTPVLFLTARDAVADRVEGFEVGGDDYLVKPFAMDELVVRVRALGRRAAPERPPVIEIGSLTIDRARAEVHRDGVVLPLTSKERCILDVLAARADQAVTRSDLIEQCWDEVYDPMSNVVDVHVGSLRRKLGSPSPLTTIRGVGFMLETGE